MTLSRPRSYCDKEFGVASSTLHFKVEPYLNPSWGMNPLEGLSGWIICSRVFVDTGFVAWTACIAAATTEDGERVPDPVLRKLICLPVAMSEDGVGEPPEELLAAFDAIAGFVQKECDSQHLDLLEERDAQADQQAAALQDDLSRAVINGEARIVDWRRSLRSGDLDSDGAVRVRSDIVRMEELINQAGRTVRKRVAAIREEASAFEAAVLSALPTIAEFEHLWVARWTTAPLRANGATEWSAPGTIMDELRDDVRWFGRHAEKGRRGHSLLPAPCSEEDVRRRKRSATIRDLDRADRERQASRRRLAARHENLQANHVDLGPEQHASHPNSSTSNVRNEHLAPRPASFPGWCTRRLWTPAHDTQRLVGDSNPFALEEQRRIANEATAAKWRSAMRASGYAGADFSDDAVVKWARQHGLQWTYPMRRPDSALNNSPVVKREPATTQLERNHLRELEALAADAHVRKWQIEQREANKLRFADRDLWFNTPKGQAYLANSRAKTQRAQEKSRFYAERRKALLALQAAAAGDWSERQDPEATLHTLGAPDASSASPTASPQEMANLVAGEETVAGKTACATSGIAGVEPQPAVSLPPASASKIIADERAAQRARWRADDEEDRVRRGKEMQRD